MSGETTPEWWVDPARGEKDTVISQMESALYQYWQEFQQDIIDRIRPAVPQSRKAARTVDNILDRLGLQF